jgi:hypothetical protein
VCHNPLSWLRARLTAPATPAVCVLDWASAEARRLVLCAERLVREDAELARVAGKARKRVAVSGARVQIARGQGSGIGDQGSERRAA